MSTQKEMTLKEILYALDHWPHEKLFKQAEKTAKERMRENQQEHRRRGLLQYGGNSFAGVISTTHSKGLEHDTKCAFNH